MDKIMLTTIADMQNSISAQAFETFCKEYGISAAFRKNPQEIVRVNLKDMHRYAVMTFGEAYTKVKVAQKELEAA